MSSIKVAAKKSSSTSTEHSDHIDRLKGFSNTYNNVIESLKSLELSSPGLPDFFSDPKKDDAPIDKSINKITIDANIKTYTMQSSSVYVYNLTNYVLSIWLNENCSNVLNIDTKKTEFQYDYGKQTNVVFSGNVAFTFKDKLFNLDFDNRGLFHKLSGNAPIAEVYSSIQNYLDLKNPLKRKHIQLVQGMNGFQAIFKKTPNISFADVIINDKLKEDIYDNTIFQLKHLQENNGIILHGVPGVGKSLICQAIVNEAIKEGFSTCFLTREVDYTNLNSFIDKFISPCVIIFEDMDSFGRSREDVDNPGIADFLQFLSGLSESKNPMIFVGTTNYLKMLDDAIANRPVRFNRKFEFLLPNENEIDQLISHYFPDCNISNEQRAKCYNRQFTGSHLKEINRTSKLLSIKRNLSIEEVFSDAVDLVAGNFSL